MLQGRQPVNNVYCFQTDRDNLSNQTEDILWIFRTIRIILDAAPFVYLHAILIDHPLQRRAIAQPIIKHFRRDALQREELVVFQTRLVFGKLHPLHRQIHLHPGFQSD